MDMTWLRPGLGLVMAGALVVTGCGTAEEEPVAGPTGTAGEIAASDFCAGAIATESVLEAGPELDDEGNPTATGLEQFDELVRSSIEQMETNAPAAIADSVEVVVENVEEQLEERDPSVTNTVEFFEADAAVDEWVFEECDLQERHEITAVNYGFEDVPSTMSAGQVGIRLDNQADEFHEAVVFSVNDPEMGIGEILKLPEEQARDKLTFKGVAFAGPGEQGSSVIELDTGRHAIVCFIPVGTTSLEDLLAAAPGGAETPTEGVIPTPDATPTGDATPTEEPAGAGEAPPHFTRGMFAEFQVE